MTNYLIKRDPQFANDIIKKKNKIIFFSETCVTMGNHRPSSYKMEAKDVVYVAEVGGGIYAKCEIIEVDTINVFSSLSQALIFFEENQKKIDNLYFFDRLSKFHAKLLEDDSYQLKFQFYKARMVEILLPYVPLTGELEKIKKNRSSVITLHENHLKYIQDSSAWQEDKLSKEIPSALRLNLYSLFSKTKGVGHIIDIDHFVPKSIGAPGNIIQNLVPIGFSLNRYKSDSIPRHFFSEALNIRTIEKKHKKEIKKILKNETEFYRKKTKNFGKISDLAKQIIKSIHNEDMKEIRNFYLSVMKKHLPEYAKIIEKEKYIKL